MIDTELFKEVSPLSAKDCFILIERQKSNFNFPIHIHPEYELNYIENAKGAQRIVGDSIEEIEEEERCWSPILNWNMLGGIITTSRRISMK